MADQCLLLTIGGERLTENATGIAARWLDLKQRRERWRNIRWTARREVTARSDSSAVEDHRHMRVVAVRRAVRRNPISDEKERLRDNHQVAAARSEETIGHTARDGIQRKLT